MTRPLTVSVMLLFGLWAACVGDRFGDVTPTDVGTIVHIDKDVPGMGMAIQPTKDLHDFAVIPADASQVLTEPETHDGAVDTVTTTPDASAVPDAGVAVAVDTTVDILPAVDAWPRVTDASPDGWSDAADAARDAADARGDVIRSCRGIRWVLPELRGARDLSGTLGGGGGVVTCGHLYRGPAPVGLSESGCQDWAALGIRTVIDLRNATEVLEAPTSECVRASSSIVSAPLSAASYTAPLDDRQSMATVFSVLADPTRYPVYVHCSNGVDRTGIVIALMLMAIESPSTQVTTEYDLSSEAGLVVNVPALHTTIDEIDRRGGIMAYLKSIGITVDQVRSIRYTLD